MYYTNYYISTLNLNHCILRYPTVCIFSTGDELKSINDTHYGYIRDTNSIMIEQILKQDTYMGQVLNFGIARDKYVN